METGKKVVISLGGGKGGIKRIVPEADLMKWEKKGYKKYMTEAEYMKHLETEKKAK